jgi:hypothetical protein
VALSNQVYQAYRRIYPALHQIANGVGADLDATPTSVPTM